MATVANNNDLYPSRTGQTSKIESRRDPVVYASAESDDVIGRRLVQQYEDDGFLVLEDVFCEHDIQVFRSELERLKNDQAIAKREETITEPGSRDVRSIFSVHTLSPLFNKLASDVRLAGLAHYLLNDEIYIHQSRANYKPGFTGKAFYWHSDFETWHVEDGMPRMRAVSMSITLTDNYDWNGPLMLIPGSHKRYVVCEGETPENHFKQSLKKQEYGVPSNDALNTLVGEGAIVSASCRAGSVIVFDCNTMHGSNSNITPAPRSNIFFVYNAMSNRVTSPFSGQAPRPEFICTRKTVNTIHVNEDCCYE